VKIPKGFGKNYFSLAAIQAYVAEVVTQATQTRNTPHIQACHHDNTQEDEEAPPDSALLLQAIPLAKRCNCIFNQRCRLVLKCAKLRGTPKCNCRHLSHRKTGISPPHSFSLFNKQKTIN